MSHDNPEPTPGSPEFIRAAIGEVMETTRRINRDTLSGRATFTSIGTALLLIGAGAVAAFALTVAFP